MSQKEEFNRDELLELLSELGRRLEAKGIKAMLYVVGGAAMAIQYDPDRRTTGDVDAIIDPSGPVLGEARKMAVEKNLRTDWLNDSAAPYVPDGPDDGNAVMYLGGMRVVLASPQRLVAMKLNAFRRQDQDDLTKLFSQLEITDEERVVELTHEMYGEDFSEGVQINETDDGLRHYARVIFDLMKRAQAQDSTS